jgi:flagellar basal body rod protein FlgG
MGVAASGMRVATRRLDVTADNVANLHTDGFRAKEVVQRPVPAGGIEATVRDAGGPSPVFEGRVVSNVDLISEGIGRIAAQRQFEANLAVFKTAAEMEREALHIIA